MLEVFSNPFGLTLNTHAYFKDVLERLPTHPASRIDELLSHR